MSQSDTELRAAIDKIFFSNYNALHDNFFESEFVAAKAATVDVLALFTQAKNELLQELLEHKQDLIFSNGIRREAVPVHVIEKYLAKGEK